MLDQWVFVLDWWVFVLDRWVFVLGHRVFVLDQWVFILDQWVFFLDRWVFVLDHRVFGLRFWIFILDTSSAPSCDHFGRHGEWKKYLAIKILAKVANWRPTDLKRNLLEKLSKIGQI